MDILYIMRGLVGSKERFRWSKEDDTLLLIMQTYDYFFEIHIFLTIK